MKTYVFVTARFAALHRWVDAPIKMPEVDFLANWHRHEFHVRLVVEVGHNDREVEFLCLKRELQTFLQTNFENAKLDMSCEMMAKKIATHFFVTSSEYVVRSVEVSEDGENGAFVTF